MACTLPVNMSLLGKNNTFVKQENFDGLLKPGSRTGQKMTLSHMANDSVHWFVEELTARVVAASGIASDRHHLGKILLQSFKDAPDFVLQTDGATGESVTYATALERSVRCANCFKNLGLRHGDVMIIMAPNHLDVTIPLYAALYLGVIVAAVDRTFTTNELQQTFAIAQPKIVFCQSDRASDVELTLNNLNLDAKIVSFDKGDYLCSFNDFMEQYGEVSSVEKFKCTDLDPEDSTAFLIATSGTTGLPKAVAVTHKNFAITTPYMCSRFTTFPAPTRLALVGSQLQWLTALLSFIASPILRIPTLTTSQNMTLDHAYDLINTYRPTFTMFTPTIMTTLIKAGSKCDFTSVELLILGGSAVPQELIDEIKMISPGTEILNAYGITELSGFVFNGDNPSPGSCGKPTGCFQYRIVDVETQEDIYEPNVTGELWVKGPTVFKEYYNNVEATEEAFAEDRWFKTGDTFYRDEDWNFFFVERIKLLLKYKRMKISPLEIESVIRQHPGVLDVAVTSVPDPETGDLPVAFVVRRPGATPSADEIKNLVKESLSDVKQLRGGVIFVDAIPMTASTKVHRRKLKQMALEMPRE